MSETYLIERQIGLDCGHRIPAHHSHCRNLHGHRYQVVAMCEGELAAAGCEQGMVLDFGFLKDAMMAEIHAPCDHGLILGVDDPLLPLFVGDDETKLSGMRTSLAGQGFCRLPDSKVGVLYIMPAVPTAENLAAHWFKRLSPRVQERSGGRARLVRISVHETPNCVAHYPA